MDGVVFLNRNEKTCEPLKYIDKNLTIYVINHLGDRCVTPSLVTPTVIIYGLILTLGFFGNVCTCLVIVHNKYMQNATNYYLFSLAVSDLLMIVLGIPMELYGVFDVLYPYQFGEFVCKLRAFLIEFTSFASILTITCFSIERWIAICFPFRAKIFSSLDRAVKVIIALWICAFIASLPVAFIVVLNKLPLPPFILQNPSLLNKVSFDNVTIAGTDFCAMDFQRPNAQKTFIYTAFLIFFLFPALLITFVYCHIVLRLTSSNSAPHLSATMTGDAAAQYERQKIQNRKSLLKVLSSVVIMFFLCWLPFHVQRLLTIFLNEMNTESSTTSAFQSIFNIVYYISGLGITEEYGYCFYLNSACNPILYNILSEKYRLAFCKTILGHKLTNKIWAKRSSLRQHYTYQVSQVLHRCSDCSMDRTQRLIHLQSYDESMTSLNNIRRKLTCFQCASKTTPRFYKGGLTYSSKNSLTLNYPQQSLSINSCILQGLTSISKSQQQERDLSNSDLKRRTSSVPKAQNLKFSQISNTNQLKFQSLNFNGKSTKETPLLPNKSQQQQRLERPKSCYHRLRSFSSLPTLKTSISKNSIHFLLSSLTTSTKGTSKLAITPETSFDIRANNNKKSCNKHQKALPLFDDFRDRSLTINSLPTSYKCSCPTKKNLSSSRKQSFSNVLSPLIQQITSSRRHSVKIDSSKKHIVLNLSKMPLLNV